MNILNITDFTTQEEILKICSNNLTIPSLILALLGFIIILPLMAWAFKSDNTAWGKFFWVWFLTTLLTGILITFLIYMPNAVYTIWEFFKNSFNF